MFAFEPSKTVINIKLAVSFSPRVRERRITSRPCSSLLHILNGEYRYTYRDGGFVARGGDVIYLPVASIPYSYVIEGDADGDVRCEQIEFQITELATGKPMAFSDRPVILPHMRRDEAVTAVGEVISSFASATCASKQLSLSALLKIFAIYEDESAEKNVSNAQRIIAPARKYIEENYSRDISSKELAEMCYMSESQLRRYFKAAVGMSPMTYKKHLLLMTAKKLLLIGELKIGEIADVLGFYDIYAFSHFFKSAQGVSPTEYVTAERGE